MNNRAQLLSEVRLISPRYRQSIDPPTGGSHEFINGSFSAITSVTFVPFNCHPRTMGTRPFKARFEPLPCRTSSQRSESSGRARPIVMAAYQAWNIRVYIRKRILVLHRGTKIHIFHILQCPPRFHSFGIIFAFLCIMGLCSFGTKGRFNGLLPSKI